MNTLAEALIEERQKKDISLETIARKTNINLHSLQALEKGDYDKLPGNFYFKNYIKSYLKAIGADEKEFLDIHQHTIERIISKSPEEEKEYYLKLSYSRFKQRRLVLTLLVLLILIIIAAYFFLNHMSFFSGFFKPGSKTTSSPVTIPRQELVLPNPAKTISPDRWPVRVQLNFLKNCWAQVIRGNEKIIEQVFNAGETTSLKGYRLQVTLGNPSGVSMMVNGKEVTYLKQLARSERIDIQPSTIKSILDRK